MGPPPQKVSKLCPNYVQIMSKLCTPRALRARSPDNPDAQTGLVCTTCASRAHSQQPRVFPSPAPPPVPNPPSDQPPLPLLTLIILIFTKARGLGEGLTELARLRVLDGAGIVLHDDLNLAGVDVDVGVEVGKELVRLACCFHLDGVVPRLQ